jgi:glucokinase
VRAIGLDVGGTKVLGEVLDTGAPAAVLHERRVPTPLGGEGLADVLGELAESLVADAGPVDAVGVGVPGLVDRAGVLRAGAHLARVRHLALGPSLAERLGVPTVVDNDANGHAVAEHRAGAAAGASEAVVVTLGTGIGAGIISGGHLLRGANGMAGEPGHMIVARNGAPCPCGQRGCWEVYASGSGLARLARDAALGGRLGAVVELAGGDAELVRGEHVTAAARGGDAEAQAVLDDFAGWIGLGLANLRNILDPDVFVIGGGLAEAADLVLPRVREHEAELVLSGPDRPPVAIRSAVLGDRAGAIGVALLASGSD